MALEQVSLRRGPSDSTPPERVPGTILIETDTGAVFLDNNAIDRIQLKDTTKLPITGGVIEGNLTVEGDVNMGGDLIVNNIQGNLHIPHGTTTGSATAYEIQLDGVEELYDGLFIIVKFHESNTGAATIYVNDYDPAPIKYAGANLASGMCMAGSVSGLVYNAEDGCWDLMAAYSSGSSGSGGGSGSGSGAWYGTCTTDSDTAAKVVSIPGYSLVTGNIVAVQFADDVESGATLNISSTGSAPIYYKGEPISSGVISAGSTGVFLYDGSSYQLIAQDSGAFPIQVKILETVCSKVAFTDSSPTYSLPNEITLDTSNLYYMFYENYLSDGSLNLRLGVFSRVVDDEVIWLYTTVYPVKLTSTTLVDNGRVKGTTTYITIYKVSIEILDYMLYGAIQLEGNRSLPSGMYAHAEGDTTLATGSGSHSEGLQTRAGGQYSHSEGKYSAATQEASHAEGNTTYSTGAAAHSEGYSSVASGYTAHGEGYLTLASGYAGHAEGYSTEASAQGSHAEGHTGLAHGISSHSEGYQCIVTNQYGGHAEGITTAVTQTDTVLNISSYSASSKTFTFDSTIGSALTVFGKIAYGSKFYVRNDLSTLSAFTKFTVSSYNSSTYTITVQESIPTTSFSPTVAVFVMSLTSNTYYPGHSEGRSTLALGKCAHSEGMYTIARGACSHAQGEGTVAYSDNQIVLGKYNVIDTAGKYALIVGNGTSDTARSNILVMDWDGNLYVNGDVGSNNNQNQTDITASAFTLRNSRPERTLVTLSASSWSSNQQTVYVGGIDSDETTQSVHYEYTSAYTSIVMAAGLYISAAVSNYVTFSCTTVPTSDLQVYVVVEKFAEQMTSIL